MFNYKENDFKSYRTLFTQVGLALGAYSSLVIKENMILVFLACLAFGFFLGSFLDKAKHG